jgi:phosphoglycolate phosphatase
MNYLALFDCDGTLVDSQANICMAMEHAFAANAIAAPPRSDIRRIVGLSVFEAVCALMPDADEAAQSRMAEGYKQAFFDLRGQSLIEEPLYVGMPELLASLDSEGWMLGVATGKSDRGLERCLDHHGLREIFVSLQTADRHPSKPHPSMVHQAIADAGSAPERTVMIGDTTYDIHMGRAAGCRTIGVSWGYHPASELREAGADDVAETMEELAAMLKVLMLKAPMLKERR